MHLRVSCCEFSRQGSGCSPRFAVKVPEMNQKSRNTNSMHHTIPGTFLGCAVHLVATPVERERVCMCVCERERACVCVGERQRERERACVCVCVCVWASTHHTIAGTFLGRAVHLVATPGHTSEFKTQRFALKHYRGTKNLRKSQEWLQFPTFGPRVDSNTQRASKGKYRQIYAALCCLIRRNPPISLRCCRLKCL